MEVRKVGVVGLGAMGAGIAQLCVEAGIDTVGREVTLEPGVYSLNGADCRKNRASCDDLPDPGIRFKLGAQEKGTP